MEIFDVFDVCVFIFMGLSAGMAIGLAIRNKQISNLKYQIDLLDNDYSNLVDSYTDRIVELHKLKFERYLKPIPPVKKDAVAKKKVGRPKGSKNKPKKDGGSTTRKYTRKSSK
jgi:hypothetical protein